MKRLRPVLALVALFVSLSVTSPVQASTIVQNFTSDPTTQGWAIFGDTNLFQYDPTNQALDVTWDSSQPDSYYYLPLGTNLTLTNSFCVTFDLNLEDVTVGNYGNELAIGLLHLSDATNADFLRADAISPNIAEFDYFPPDSYGDPDSLDATLVDTQNNFFFAYDNVPLTFATTYHVLIYHVANSPSLGGALYSNGQLVSSLPNIYNSIATNDDGSFLLDTLSISSYQDDGYGDSTLAHGTIQNLAIASPLPVSTVITAAPGQIQFASDPSWAYTLQDSTDLQNWTADGNPVPGNGTNLTLQATNVSANATYYRVIANLQ